MEREQLQRLHLALEAAVEQLVYAQELVLADRERGEPSAEFQAIDEAFAKLTAVRNTVRERLMRALAKPTLNIIK